MAEFLSRSFLPAAVVEILARVSPISAAYPRWPKCVVSCRYGLADLSEQLQNLGKGCGCSRIHCTARIRITMYVVVKISVASHLLGRV